MTPEKKLWQSVVLKALTDATAEDPYGSDNLRAKRDAQSWLESGGKDFRMVCALAEMDPDFVREKYLGGKIDAKLLRASEDAVMRAAE
jgi:hypothetical protein